MGIREKKAVAMATALQGGPGVRSRSTDLLGRMRIGCAEGAFGRGGCG